MTRWLARLTLAAIAVAALIPLWLLRIQTTTSAWWSGHDPRIGVLVGGAIILVVGAIVIVSAAICILVVLWDLAFGDS